MPWKRCMPASGTRNESMNNKRILGNSLLLTAAIIWGLAFVFQRVGMERIGPFTFNAARTILGAMAVGLVSSIHRSGPDASANVKRSRSSTVKGGVLCGIFLYVASTFQQIGLVYTTAGKAGFITAMYMLLVPVVNLVLFRKRSPLLVWLAVIVGLVGMYLLCVTEGFSLSVGDAYVLVCAVFYCFHILSADRFSKEGDPIRISAIQFAVAAVLSTITAFIAEDPSWESIVAAAVPILYAGLMSSGVGFTCQIVGQKYSEPATASILMSMESVFAMIFGMIILKESMSVKETIGCLVMFAAVIMVQFPNPRVKDPR